MKSKLTTVAAALAIAAVPAVAQAHGGDQGSGHGPDATEQSSAGEHGHGHHGRNPLVAYEARGTVSAVDATAMTVTIDVPDKHGATNHHAAAWRGTSVTFDVSKARVRVRDVNGDGKRDLNDVAVGDVARVLAFLPRTLSSTDVQPFAAKRVEFKHVVTAPAQPAQPTS